MDHFDSEIDSIELAGCWIQQLRSCLEIAKVRAESNPEGARRLLQPAAELANQLRATHAAVDSLTEQIQTPA